jgi:GTPase SAR1 family protein
MFKTQYAKLLERTVEEQKKELTSLREENRRLVARLLLKNQIPLAPDDPQQIIDDKKVVEQILETASIFDDLEGPPDGPEDVVDNRKGEKIDSLY